MKSRHTYVRSALVMGLTAATLRTAHRILPNPRTVTLTPQNQTDQTPITGVTAYRRPWGRQELQTLGPAGIESEHTVFLLAVETLAGNVPQNGWRITDDEANVWTILSRTLELEGALYRCPCVQNVS